MCVKQDLKTSIRRYQEFLLENLLLAAEISFSGRLKIEIDESAIKELPYFLSSITPI